MIYVESVLQVADNSGALKAQCIKVLKNKKFAKIGDEIVVTIKKAKPNTKIKKGEIHKAIVIRTKKELRRLDGTTIQFKNNEIILINPEKQPIGNRVFGPVTYELREQNLLKIISLSPTIL